MVQNRWGQKIVDVKCFGIGIVVGLVLAIVIGIAITQMFPYTSIEDVCFEQTFTPAEYEDCIRMLKENK